MTEGQLHPLAALRQLARLPCHHHLTTTHPFQHTPQRCSHPHVPHVSAVALAVLPVPCQQNKRYALLGAFAFGQGLSVGPLVEVALAINPAIVLTAALSTAAIFASFTLSALITKRRWVPRTS